MTENIYILLIHKKLSGQLSDEEAVTLMNWLENSPENQAIFADFELIYSQSKRYEPNPNLDTQKAKEKFFKELIPAKQSTTVNSLERPAKRTFTSILSPLSIAAAFVLIIAAIFIIRMLQDEDMPEFMRVEEPLLTLKNDSRSFYKLEDGSIFWLKPGSIFRYEEDFNKKERIVYLEGELFIHVASDAEKPFIIKMEQNELRVLGTAFYLRSDKTDVVTLIVQDGLVEFVGIDGSLSRVKEGEQKQYSKSSGQFLNDVDQNPVLTDWRKDYLVFNNESIITVFNKLSVFYGVDFNISCRNIDEMQGFTSPVQVSDSPNINSFLITLEKVFGISIDKIDDNSYDVRSEPCK